MFNGPGFSFEKWQVIGSKGRIRLIASNQRRRLVVCASGGACEEAEGFGFDERIIFNRILEEIIKILLREGFIKNVQQQKKESFLSENSGSDDDDEDKNPHRRRTEPPRYPCSYCRTVRTVAEIARLIYENVAKEYDIS